MRQVKIIINKMQWEWLQENVRKVAMVAPLIGYELETCTIAEMYKRRLHAFTFYTPGKFGMAFSFQQSEAIAMNRFFGDTSEDYNVFIRALLEPKLIPAK